MYLKADAQIMVYTNRVELSPGCYRYDRRYEWGHGRIAAISDHDLREIYGERQFRMWEILQFAGLRVRIVRLRDFASNAILEMRSTGWRANFVCARIWLAYKLRFLDVILLRTAWAWHLLDYDAASIPGWWQFRPYRWVMGLFKKEGE